jgi:glutaminyl-tRNA synthetase
VMGVLNPLKVVIDNYPEDLVEEMEAVNNPEDASQGTRKVPFSRILYIERDDFRREPPPKYYRLTPGREVRLRYAYFVRCTDVVVDEKSGEVVEIHCTYDPETRGGDAPDGRKVKATLHWVSADHAIPVEARMYDRLFTKEDPSALEEGEDFVDYINQDSLEIVSNAMVEPGLSAARPGEIVQFERQGYFCVDPDTTDKKLVFNRTVSLRDTWAKIQQSMRTN